MKKGSLFCIPAIVAVMFFFLYPIRPVCAIELSADEQAYLSSKETIVFVSQTRYPPFEFVDKNNEHTGMCIELARWIATDLVISGKADAVIGDKQIVLYHIFKDKLTDKVKKVGDPLYIGQNCMATMDANPVLISILNKGIKMAQKSGVLEKINRKWIGIHYTLRESWLFKYPPHLSVATGTLLVLALLVWFWNIRLHQAVREGTEKLQKSEERYRSLTDDVLDSLMVGIFILDSEFRVVSVNMALERYFGLKRSEVIGKDKRLLIREVIKDVFEEPEIFCEKILAAYDDNNYIENFECHVLPSGKRQERWLEHWSQPIQSGFYVGGRIEHYTDITERKQALRKIHGELESRAKERTLELVTANGQLKQEIEKRKNAEKKLWESKEKYCSLVESTKDAIYLIDRDLRYLFANEKLLSRFGLPFDRVIGIKYGELHSKKETKDFAEKVNKVFKSRKSLSYEYQSKRDDRYFIRTLSPVIEIDGSLKTLTVISKDFTERKQAEQKLKQSLDQLTQAYRQRKLLSGQLINLLEREHQQFAMDLHDDIGQLLASIKMVTEMILEKVQKKEDNKLLEEIILLQETTMQLMKSVRDFSHWLRPGMLGNLGLTPSLNSLLDDIRAKSNIEINFFTKDLPERFDREKEIACFRIAQESLSNIIKHAGAKHVFINIVKNKKTIYLNIEDDGTGFKPEMLLKESKVKGPLGLFIMRERAVQLGGTFTIDSQPGKGTNILMKIPM